MLHDLLRCEASNLVFLLETKLLSRQLDSIKWHGGFMGCIGVDSDGKGGGLALLWKASMEVSLISLSKHHIHTSTDSFDGTPWLFTSFFGHPDTTRKEETWELLKNLQPVANDPWLVRGDFNEIMKHEEKHGGHQRPEHQMQ